MKVEHATELKQFSISLNGRHVASVWGARVETTPFSESSAYKTVMLLNNDGDTVAVATSGGNGQDVTIAEAPPRTEEPR